MHHTTGLVDSIDAEYEAVIEEGKEQAPKVHFDEMYNLGLVKPSVRSASFSSPICLGTDCLRPTDIDEVEWSNRNNNQCSPKCNTMFSDDTNYE